MTDNSLQTGLGTYLVEAVRKINSEGKGVVGKEKPAGALVLGYDWAETWEEAVMKAEDLFSKHFDTSLPFDYKGTDNSELSYKNLAVNIIKMTQTQVSDTERQYNYKEEEQFVFFGV